MTRHQFTAAGKTYTSPEQLTAIKTKWEHVYQDCYGRTVLYYTERFPCFDVYDRMYEKRYFHHYLIQNGLSWTLVRAEDESDRLSVWENRTTEQVRQYDREKMIDKIR